MSLYGCTLSHMDGFGDKWLFLLPKMLHLSPSVLLFVDILPLVHGLLGPLPDLSHLSDVALPQAPYKMDEKAGDVQGEFGEALVA